MVEPPCSDCHDRPMSATALLVWVLAVAGLGYWTFMYFRRTHSTLEVVALGLLGAFFYIPAGVSIIGPVVASAL